MVCHLALFLIVFFVASKVGEWLAPKPSRPPVEPPCNHLYEHCAGQTWCHNCGKSWDTGDQPEN